MNQPDLFTFHNSTNLQGAELHTSTAKAQSQKEVIYEFLKERSGKRYTAILVHAVLKQLGHNMMLTSVRRSLSDLTTEGKIKHHKEHLTVEKYGAKNTSYSI